MGSLISYPEQRALEDVAYSLGLQPTRILTVLLPIWRVEVRATVTEGEDYELIDRYIERAIAETGIDTVAGLSWFLALDEVIVHRTMSFLATIEHVRYSDGRFTLTELGIRSVRDRKSYRTTRNDRRHLYFDAFGSRPLTRPYYDARAVTFIERDELSTVLAEHKERVFALANTPAFRPNALADLVNAPDRDSFNLPERIDIVESTPAEYVYLPLYVVRAVRAGHPPRHVAYSQVSRESDPYLTSMCEQTPEIVSACTYEWAPDQENERTRITTWLRKQGLAAGSPVRTAEGGWRVTLPAAAFGRGGGLNLSLLGTYVMLGNVFFLAWCADESARKRAMAERVKAYLNARPYSDRDRLIALIDRISRQLDLGTVTIGTLRRWANEFGHSDLAGHLATLG